MGFVELSYLYACVGAHVEVDVVAGVVAAQMSCLVSEVTSYRNLYLSACYLVVLPAE